MSVAYQWFLFNAFAYFTRRYYSRTFYEHVGRFLIFFVIIMRAVHVTITFCSSRGCLWKCVTVRTRLCHPKRLSIFILINIFCGLERSLHPFGPDFDTVLNSLLLSDSTLTHNSIRNIWVTEAKYSLCNYHATVITKRRFRCSTSTSWTEKHFNFPTLVTWRSSITSPA